MIKISDSKKVVKLVRLETKKKPNSKTNKFINMLNFRRYGYSDNLDHPIQ